MDDTGVTINELSAPIKDDRAQDQNARTGVHTTGSVAGLPEGKIAIFHSGLQHAGEFFFKLMEAKTSEDMVVVMSVAASSNSCHFADVAVEVTEANCNSHAVRKFKEWANNPAFAEHAEPILAQYAEIFKIEKSLAGASPQERLKTHTLRSLPLMEQIPNQVQEDFRRCRVEPNSELGKNYRYFLKHFTELSAFCHVESAPVCNNIAERLLKRAIRHRKNSLFFKNRVGSAVGDIHMSILMTAVENGIEPVQYMTNLLNVSGHRKANPQDWLPWQYEKTLAELGHAQPLQANTAGPSDTVH